MHCRHHLHSISNLFLVATLFLTGMLQTRVLAATTDGYPKDISDAHGNTVTVAQPFTKIISLYSAHTENLCSMGAASQLAGISTSDDFPAEILHKTTFSYREDPEKFIAQRPDLILVRPMIERSYPQFIEKLRSAGITVISLQPTSIEEMFEYWRKLGILSGHEREALAMTDTFKKRIDSFTQRLQGVPESKRVKVYFEAIHKKMKTFAEDSIAMYVLHHAGGVNIASDASRVRRTNIAFFGKEKLLSRGESVDIFLSQYGRMNPVTTDIIKNEPGFGAIRAVREGNIHLIEEPLVSRPTMRILLGIEKLYALFYPTRSTSQENRS